MKRSNSEGRWADIPSARIRFSLEAAFLILVAVGAAVAQLSPLMIIVLMLVAWLLVALIERASSREHPVIEPVETEEPAAIAAREGYRWLFWRRQREAALPSPTEPLEERPARAHVRRIEPEPAPVAEAEVIEVVVAEPVAQVPAVTKQPLDLPGLEEPEKPAEPVVAPTPPPARVEQPPPSPPVREPAPVPSPPPAPRPPAQEWNLWDLERRARARAGDTMRDEEWAALFMHLREFASAEGTLPKEFDDLVRESFAELIQAA